MIERKKKICKRCKEESYIFGKGLCVPCYSLVNYKPLPKGKPLVSNVEIKKVSDNQKRKTKDYLKLRKDFLSAHPICQCCKTNFATDIHHKAGRDGDNLYKHFLAVCRRCHTKIEENPSWAKQHGYSISRLNEEDTPNSKTESREDSNY